MKSDYKVRRRKMIAICWGLILGHMGVAALLFYPPIDNNLRVLLILATGAAMWWAAIEVARNWCPHRSLDPLQTP